MILCTRREPRGNVPVTETETWDLSEMASEDGVESVLVRSGVLGLSLSGSDEEDNMKDGIDAADAADVGAGGVEKEGSSPRPATAVDWTVSC